MAAAAFGFSIGDFFAAIKLLSKAAKALREASGARNQFQHAAIEIEIIHNILNQVQSLTPEKCNPDSIRKIHLCALSCHIPLARFVSKLQKLEPQLGAATDVTAHAGVREKFLMTRRKLQWAFTLENDLKKLKQQLGLQFSAIAIWLQMEALERAAETQHSSRQTVAEMNLHAEHVQATVQELKASVAAVSTRRKQSEDEQVASKAAHQSIEKTLGKYCRQTQFDVAKMEAQFVVVQDMLGDLKQQIRNVRPPTSIPHFGAHFDDATPATASNHPQIESEDKTSQVKFQDAGHLFAIMHAIWHRIEQVLLALLLLMPSFTRIYRTFLVMSRSPSFLSVENIYLEDALGRTLSLPYEQFRHWSEFVSRLRSVFIGMPGEFKVQQNHFHIFNMQVGGPLMFTSDSWERNVFPGARLAMSMVYRTDVLADTVCPRCQAMSVDASAGSWMQCHDCMLTYRVLREHQSRKHFSHRARLTDRAYIADPGGPDLGMHVGAGATPLASTPDASSFKRIHVIPESTQHSGTNLRLLSSAAAQPSSATAKPSKDLFDRLSPENDRELSAGNLLLRTSLLRHDLQLCLQEW